MIGDPLQLGQHRVDVDGARGVADDQDPIPRLAEGVRRPAVVRAHAGGGDVLRVLPELRAERADRPRITLEHQLGRDPLPVHLGQSPIGVPGAQVPTRRPDALGVDHRQELGREVGEHAEELRVPRVVLVHLGKVVVILGLQVAGPRIRRHGRVRVP